MNNQNVEWINKRCLLCGKQLIGKQKSYCCRDHSFIMYKRGLKVKALRLLINDDSEFKLILSEYPIDLLSFGHKNNDGWNHRKDENLSSGTQTIVWILNNPLEAREIFEVTTIRQNQEREIVEKELKALSRYNEIKTYQRFK